MLCYAIIWALPTQYTDIYMYSGIPLLDYITVYMTLIIVLIWVFINRSSLYNDTNTLFVPIWFGVLQEKANPCEPAYHDQEGKPSVTDASTPNLVNANSLLEDLPILEPIGE